MNRRQKIIVSVTGIFLVLLILVGLTYAYFLTRINGNPNNTSISVTTANLELTYTDGNGVLTPAKMLVPGDDVTFLDGNKNEQTSKTFTVTNNGNDTEYVVFIDNVSVTYATTSGTQIEGTATTFESNDFRYTLTCTITSSDASRNNTSCNGVEKGTFPLTNESILVENDILKGDVHNYTLTMEYLETGRNQSNDMNKTLSAQINIEDIHRLNPYSDNEDSLAYNIINNAKENKNGTRLVATPPSKVAEEISSDNWDLGEEVPNYYNDEHVLRYAESEDAFRRCDGYSDEETGEYIEDCSGVKEYTSCTSEVKGKYVLDEHTWDTIYVSDCENGRIVVGTVKYEKVLSTTPDDLGTSYYYRGLPEDNYVTFAGMCWRIVRINGDGTTKLILEDQDQPCSTSINGNWGIPTTTGGSTYTGNFGYTQYNKNTLTASDGTQNSGTKYIMDYLHGQTNSASSMATAFKNFQSTFTETELSKLKSGNWCMGDAGYSRAGSSNSDYTYTLLNETQMMDNKIKGTSFYYDSYVRLGGANKDGFQPTLKCNGTIMNDWDDDTTNPTPMYVGGITADEMVYAGANWTKNNLNFYLMNDSFKNGELDYYYFWSLSPYYFNSANDGAFGVSDDGSLSDVSVNSSSGAFRPAVSLASSAVITSGEGTLESPYVIG